MEHPVIITSQGEFKIKKPRWAFFRKLVDKARQQIMEQEDAEIFKHLDAVAKDLSKNE